VGHRRGEPDRAQARKASAPWKWGE
jgi:hypothetical protein